MTKFVYKHNLGKGITEFMEDKVFPLFEADEQNDSYDSKDSEGLIDTIDTVCTDGFENEIKKFVEYSGYNLEDEDDAAYICENERFKLCSTVSWDEETVSLSYAGFFYYLIDENGQHDLDVPSDYKFYLEDVLNGIEEFEKVETITNPE